MSVEKYTKEVPIELRKAISGFDNDIRLSIFLVLNKHGELSFSEIAQKLGMNKQKAKMDFHLDKLTKSAVVEHKYKHQIGNEKYSFYSLTSYSRNLWNNIVSSLKPTSPILKKGLSSDRYRIDKIDFQTEIKSVTKSDYSSLPLTIIGKKQIRKKMPEMTSGQVVYNSEKIS